MYLKFLFSLLVCFVTSKLIEKEPTKQYKMIEVTPEQLQQRMKGYNVQDRIHFILQNQDSIMFKKTLGLSDKDIEKIAAIRRQDQKKQNLQALYINKLQSTLFYTSCLIVIIIGLFI